MKWFINSLEFNSNKYYFIDLNLLYEKEPSLKKLPNILKILLESNIRNAKTQESVNTIIDTFTQRNTYKQIDVNATRVIMDEELGIPLIVDLVSANNTSPKRMLDLILKYSNENKTDDKKLEKNKNEQRHKFIKWASKKLDNFCVVPPSKIINNKINFEYLSTMISSIKDEDKIVIYPELLLGPDENSTNINALGVLGWLSAPINTQNAILGDSINIDFPSIIGVEITGSLAQAVSINDVAFSLIEQLKNEELKECFIEFHGNGIKNISLEDRLSLCSILIKHGFKSAYFPIDDKTISFVEQTRGVDASLIKQYYKNQKLFVDDNIALVFDRSISLDMSSIKAYAIGPSINSQTVLIDQIPAKIDSYKIGNFVKDNDIVFAAINSTNHNVNISFLIQAALVAKKASDFGLQINSNIIRYLSIDSPVIKMYLEKLDLIKYFKKLNFELISFYDENSEVLERVELDISKYNLNVASLAWCYEHEGMNLPADVKSNWFMSPAMIVAYCLKGTIDFDITKEQIAQGVYLSDIWPSMNEVNECLELINNDLYNEVYKDTFVADEWWENLEVNSSDEYSWSEEETYIQKTFFDESLEYQAINIKNAKVLALFDDDVSSDSLSAMGKISPYSTAASYLEQKGLKPDEFDTFENRVANSEVLSRGTLGNISLKNRIVSPKEGGYTKDFETLEIMPIYDFAMKQKNKNIPLVIFASENFGYGKQNDWAAKGLKLLGVKAIIAKSFDKNFERSLIAMGILPLEFIGDDVKSLAIFADELISLETQELKTNDKVYMHLSKANEIRTITLLSKLKTTKDLEYYKNGGSLNYLIKS